MDFVKRVDLKVGQKLLVEIPQPVILGERNRPKELLTTYGTGGSKDEPILLTVTGFSKRDITAIDRYGEKFFFSKKTGKRNSHEDFARVATDTEIAEIEAIIDYNRKVAAVRALLDRGPGRAWDAVIELLISPVPVSPYHCPDTVFSKLTVSQCYDCDPEVPF